MRASVLLAKRRGGFVPAFICWCSKGRSAVDFSSLMRVSQVRLRRAVKGVRVSFGNWEIWGWVSCIFHLGCIFHLVTPLLAHGLTQSQSTVAILNANAIDTRRGADTSTSTLYSSSQGIHFFQRR